MQLRLLIASFGLLGAAALGCSKMEPMDTADMAMPVQMDMRKPGSCVDNEGTKAVGEACTNSTKCDCSGPKPTCLSSLEFGETIDLPGSYCSNAGCTINQNDTCGDNGVCADAAGDGNPLCFQKCRKGQCRADYSCVNIATDPNSATSKSASVCLPKDGLVDCDPTADPATQCSSIGGTMVSTLTNGNPNAACLRIGPDPAGQCRYLPCQIGAKNCPALSGNAYGCFYFDVQRNTQNPDPADKFKGEICLPVPGMQKKDGDTCMGGFNTCGDNFYCDAGTCRQLCYSGTQPTFMGGNMMYKNAATACPMGRTCADAFGLKAAGATNWAGVCRP